MGPPPPSGRARPTGGPFSRRRALGLAGAGLAALTAGAGWRATRGEDHVSLAATAEGEPFASPPLLDSAGGRLQVELTAAPGVRLAGVGSSALGYNGASPGPTIRVRPGDSLAVRLVNSLGEPTNLHTHGLRVSPEGRGDNPFVHADPGSSLDYHFAIPDDHPAGTFWYHPHRHGSTAAQVFGGLAGALLVVPREGDGAGEPAVDADHVLVVTDTTLRPDGSVAGVGKDAVALGREGALVLVNGRRRPVIAAAPGETQRWRIVNACASRVFSAGLEGMTVHHIALDGSFLPGPVERDRVLLSPGGRADLLVRPGAAGRFRLVGDPVDRGRLGASAPDGEPFLLAVLAVDGPAAVPARLPSSLPAAADPSGAIDRRRAISLTMRQGLGGMTFGLDGREHDPARDDLLVRAGDTEEWLLDNEGPLAHPFHLHVWPFAVLATSDGAEPMRVLQDVVLVPARGWARIRIPFTGQTGRSVYHCHILDHGDRGMTGTVLVT